MQNLAFKNIVFLLKFPREKIYALEAFVYKASRGIKKDGVKTVSYTHLDVYKRQSLKSSQSNGEYRVHITIPYKEV